MDDSRIPLVPQDLAVTGGTLVPPSDPYAGEDFTIEDEAEAVAELPPTHAAVCEPSPAVSLPSLPVRRPGLRAAD